MGPLQFPIFTIGVQLINLPEGLVHVGDLPDPFGGVLGDGAVHGLRLEVADRLVARGDLGRDAEGARDALPESQLGDLVLGHVDFEEALRVARVLLLQGFDGLLDLIIPVGKSSSELGSRGPS